jgi:TPR repeat protein
MPDSIVDITKKATAGDAAAMVNLGIDFDKRGNYYHAEIWWTKAANSGAASGAYNLVYYIYGGFCRIPDSRKLLHWLHVLSDEHKHGWAKIVLGTIYSGLEKKFAHLVWENVLSAEEIESMKNPDRGIALIDEGISLIEAGDNRRPLDFNDYWSIAWAYTEYDAQAAKRVPGYQNAKIRYLQRASEYFKKAQADAPPDMPSELFTGLIGRITMKIQAFGSQ